MYAPLLPAYTSLVRPAPPLLAKRGKSVVLRARAYPRALRPTPVCARFMSVLARCAVRASQPVAASMMMGTFSAEPMLSHRARMSIPLKCSLRHKYQAAKIENAGSEAPMMK